MDINPENGFLILTIIIVLFISAILVFRTGYFKSVYECVVGDTIYCFQTIMTSVALAISCGVVYWLLPDSSVQEEVEL